MSASYYLHACVFLWVGILEGVHLHASLEEFKDKFTIRLLTLLKNQTSPLVLWGLGTLGEFFSTLNEIIDIQHKTPIFQVDGRASSPILVSTITLSRLKNAVSSSGWVPSWVDFKAYPPSFLLFKSCYQ